MLKITIRTTTFDLWRLADYVDLSVEYTVKDTNQKAPGIKYTLSKAWSYILEVRIFALGFTTGKIKSSGENLPVHSVWRSTGSLQQQPRWQRDGVADAWRPQSSAAGLRSLSCSMEREAAAIQNISNKGLGPSKGIMATSAVPIWHPRLLRVQTLPTSSVLELLGEWNLRYHHKRFLVSHSGPFTEFGCSSILFSTFPNEYFQLSCFAKVRQALKDVKKYFKRQFYSFW